MRIIPLGANIGRLDTGVPAHGGPAGEKVRTEFVKQSEPIRVGRFDPEMFAQLPRCFRKASIHDGNPVDFPTLDRRENSLSLVHDLTSSSDALLPAACASAKNAVALVKNRRAVATL
jgi:hypothetical protein